MTKLIVQKHELDADGFRSPILSNGGENDYSPSSKLFWDPLKRQWFETISGTSGQSCEAYGCKVLTNFAPEVEEYVKNSLYRLGLKSIRSWGKQNILTILEQCYDLHNIELNDRKDRYLEVDFVFEADDDKIVCRDLYPLLCRFSAKVSNVEHKMPREKASAYTKEEIQYFPKDKFYEKIHCAIEPKDFPEGLREYSTRNSEGYPHFAAQNLVMLIDTSDELANCSEQLAEVRNVRNGDCIEVTLNLANFLCNRDPILFRKRAGPLPMFSYDMPVEHISRRVVHHLLNLENTLLYHIPFSKSVHVRSDIQEIQHSE